jgi:dTDP-4-amino-4,6-dideoxygalactose transaminase
VVEETWNLRLRELEVRRANATRLLRAAKEMAGVGLVRPIPEADPGWLRLPFVVHNANRKDSRLSEARSLGVMPGYPRSLDTLEALPPPEPKLPLPGAAALAKGLWTLPTHSQLNELDLRRLEALLESLSRALRQ